MTFNATDEQVGGSHYKDMAIQPVEFILKNGLGFCEGNVIKYLCRWRRKGGVEDLEKARHYIDMLIDAHTVKPDRTASSPQQEPARPSIGTSSEPTRANSSQ